MPDQVMATDPQEATTTPPQGTVAPADDLAQGADGQGQQPTPTGFDEDFLKKLDALDPTSLPQTFKEKFVPKAEFTKGRQEFADERKKFEAEKAAQFELMRRVISERPVAPTGPTAEEVKLKELSELAASGDSSAQMQMADILAERKVAPLRTQMTLQNAAQAARSNPLAGPAVVEHWGEIVQTMQQDPVIATLATANNYAAADRVMVALGLEHMVRNLQPRYAEAQEKIKSLEAKLQGYERERTAGLPSSTTRAGTTAGRPVAGEPRTLEEVDLKRAWLEAGGTEDTFR
jgi:hypothetical protein